MGKNSRTVVIVEELLAGGVSVDEIRDRVLAKVPNVKGAAISAQIKGVLANVKRGSTERWKAYKLSEGKIGIEKVVAAVA